MKLSELSGTLALTVILSISVAVAAAANYTARLSNPVVWEAHRCDPGVIPIAAAFKPANDPRTPTEFARDNWSFCQKEYVQRGIRAAAEAPQELLRGQEGIVGVAEGLVDDLADTFVNLWKFCYSAYAGFMDQMKGGAKLFHNFMIQLHSIVGRLQGAALSIVYGLIATIVASINSVQLVLIVAIVIIGIMIAISILLFFVFPAIFSLTATMTALVATTAVAVATAVAAAEVAELFSPEVCFAAGTPVLLANEGETMPIERLTVGTHLRDGGRITALHRFRSAAPLFLLNGVRATGSHLVQHPDEPRRLIPVSEHPAARRIPRPYYAWLFGEERDLWCLTTTTRRIPIQGDHGVVVFADWEEIPEGDDAALAHWYRRVWLTLNPGPAVVRAPPRVLKAEAALSPDCALTVWDPWWGRTEKRLATEVQVGAWVLDGSGLPTRVVGRVDLAGDQSTDAVELAPGCLVSVATWVRRPNGLWLPATEFPVRELHPVRWVHFYTEAGTLLVGGWSVRDASEVGLDRLDDLVEEVVLGAEFRATI
jgi:hypothetical protein